MVALVDLISGAVRKRIV